MEQTFSHLKVSCWFSAAKIRHFSSPCKYRVWKNEEDKNASFPLFINKIALSASDTGVEKTFMNMFLGL